MSIKILKFGGSSIADAGKIVSVYNIVKKKSNEYDYAIVLSALQGITNKLSSIADQASNRKNYKLELNDLIALHIKCVENLNFTNNKSTISKLEKIFNELRSDLSSVFSKNHISAKDLDKVLSFGEILSTLIIADYFNERGTSSEQLDARSVIATDNNFGNAFVHYKETFTKIRNYFHGRNKLQIITGFLGATQSGETTTIGRNGSDYTATIFGAALNAKKIEIWTNINGIKSANPNFVENSETISDITYKEAMELAHAGADVIFPPSLIPALYKNIPISIKNTFNPEHIGTKIYREVEKRRNVIVGISSQSDISLVRLQGAGLVGLKGTIGRIFSSISKEKINIRLISMAFSEHSICFAINPKNNKKAIEALKLEFEYEIKNKLVDQIVLEKDLSLVAVVGEGMRKNPGVSGRVFSTLGDLNISIIAIAQGSSERNISFIVRNKDISEALEGLHCEFFDNQAKTTDIYLAGIGNIGKELLKIIKNDPSSKIRILAVASSKKMLLKSSGLEISKIKSDLLSKGEVYSINQFLDYNTISRNKKIFVDCTASESIAKKYSQIIDKGFSIVTASKIANSIQQSYYNEIRKKIKSANLNFNYETNVGAGLPVISTLKSLISTGDIIIKIQGVLSGTLSYLFSSFDGTIPFSKLVKDAKKKGFTEPDPREDLNGNDVARKILIMARETGAELNLSDIEIQNLVPKSIDKECSVEQFLVKLRDFDQAFFSKFEKARKEEKVLRYIGSWEEGSAKVGLRAVGPESPFYHQKGRENFVLFKTKRYNDIPLIIKGHGAGADVTAAGVLRDIQLCQK